MIFTKAYGVYSNYEDFRDNLIAPEENRTLYNNVQLNLVTVNDLDTYSDGISIAIGYGFDLLVRTNNDIQKKYLNKLTGAPLTLSASDGAVLDLARPILARFKAVDKNVRDADAGLSAYLDQVILNESLVVQTGAGNKEKWKKIRNFYEAQLTFTLDNQDQDQAMQLLNVHVERAVEKHIDAVFEDSVERAVLMSVLYQLPNSPFLKSLANATAPSNLQRVKIWSEIRYFSGDYSSRRNHESDTFGLYDGNTSVPSTSGDAVATVDYLLRGIRKSKVMYKDLEPGEKTELMSQIAPSLSFLASHFKAAGGLDSAYLMADTEGTLDTSTLDINGKDLIAGSGSGDTIRAGADADVLLGNGGEDHLYGDAGNDRIEGGTGGDSLYGGADDDYLYGHSESNIGDDNAVDTILGEGGQDHIWGGGGADVLDGGTESDHVYGGAGEDQINGGLHGDFLYGHSISGANDDSAVDTIKGGQGDDQIWGNGGDDELYGDGGVDTIQGGRGADQIEGGDKADKLYGHTKDGANDDSAVDTIKGGQGDDQIWGNGGDDELYGDGGADTIQGGRGADQIEGGDKADKLYGHTKDGANDDSAVDTIRGGKGADEIYGADKLYGDAGIDTLDGGAGNDTLDGGAGADILAGGQEFDTYIADELDTITDDGNSGEVQLNGTKLIGGKRKESDPENTFKSEDAAFTYVLNGSTLVVNGGLTITGFQPGGLGIQLETEDEEEDAENSSAGDDRDSGNTDPLAFDLDGSGDVVSISLSSSNTYFDLDADGVAEKTGWINPNDGLLVLDKDQSGDINSINELFGDANINGFDELRILADSNDDGAIDNQDALFSSLQIWQDINSDGLSQSHELYTLADFDITSIDLSHTRENLEQNGNVILASGSFTRAGNQEYAAAFDFFIDNQITKDTITHNVNPHSRISLLVRGIDLPFMRGLGGAFDFHNVYANDDAFLQDVQELAESSAVDIVENFDHILHQWVGLTDLREQGGIALDIPITTEEKLWIFEKFAGISEFSQAVESSIVSGNLPSISRINEEISNNRYERIIRHYRSRFLAQSVFEAAFEGTYYSLALNDIRIKDVDVFQNSFTNFAQSLTSTEEALFLLQTYNEFRDEASLNQQELVSNLAGYPVASVFSDYFSGDYDEVWTVDRGMAVDRFTLNVVNWYMVDDTGESNNLDGGEGNDFINGLSGDDVVSGFSGNDKLLGGVGDDEILGGHGNDVLIGGSGDDDLRGGAGDDLLVGGDGNDRASGSVGNDTYQFTSGEGNFEINNGGWSEDTDTLVLMNLVLEDVEFIRDSDDLLVIVNSTSELITINDYFDYDANEHWNLDKVEFSDGTEVGRDYIKHIVQQGSASDDLLIGYEVSDTLAGLNGNDVLEGRGGGDTLTGGAGEDRLVGGDGDDVLLGGIGNDNLIGGAGDDLLVGGSGDDRASGGVGSDTYQFTSGEGSFEISNGSWSEDTDKLVLMNLALEDVEFIRDFQDLVVVVNSTSELITIKDYFNHDANEHWNLDKVEFSDGTEVGRDYIKHIVQQGTASDDVLIGYEVSDTLAGLNGNDVIEGRGGEDTLTGGAGADRLDGGEGDDVLLGGEGEDLLAGGNGDDILRGGLGLDHLSGDGGNDTYVFEIGDGRAHIYNDDNDNASLDKISFGEGIVLEDLTFKRVHDNLIVEAGEEIFASSNVIDDEIIVVDFFKNDGLSPAAIDEVHFHSGETLNIDQIKVMVQNQDDGDNIIVGFDHADIINSAGGNDLISANGGDDIVHGGSGDDRIFGGDGDDQLYGDSGSDLIEGGQGNDHYYLTQDSDADYIRVTHPTSEFTDVLHVGDAILPEDVVVAKVGSSFVLHLKDTPNMVFLEFRHGVNVEFDNGVVWDPAHINANAADITEDSSTNAIVDAASSSHLMLTSTNLSAEAVGDSRDNILLGRSNKSNVLNGGAGADLLWGGTYTDLYFVDDVNDVVVEARRDKQHIIQEYEGIDTVVSSVNHTLASGIENLYLSESTVTTAEGNELNNIIFAPVAGVTLTGGDGDDIYIVNSSATVVEANDGGNDTIVAIGSGEFYLSDYANIENAKAGSANSTLHGNDGDNVLWSSGRDVTQEWLNSSKNKGWAYFRDYLDHNNSGTTFYAGAGDDTVHGGVGMDVIHGGIGNDLLEGEGGSDYYHYELGDGNDIIKEQNSSSSNGQDKLIFGDTVEFSDLSFSRNEHNLIIAVQTGSVTIENQFVTSSGSSQGYSPASYAGVEGVSVLYGTQRLELAMADVKALIDGDNLGPKAMADNLLMNEDQTIDIDVATLLNNDVDLNNDALSLIEVQNATEGVVSLDTSAGVISFQASTNYNGTASFEYTVSDGQGGVDTVTVDVAVQAVNDKPLAVDDSLVVVGQTPLTIQSVELLANDLDIDGDNFSISAVGNAQHGTVSLSTINGEVSFTADAGFVGIGSFVYTISDDQGGTATATVNVDVKAENSVPVAVNDVVDAVEQTPLLIQADQLLSNDSDGDGDALSISAVANAQNGSVSLNASTGEISFTPADGFVGDGSFEYTVIDDKGGEASAPLQCILRPIQINRLLIMIMKLVALRLVNNC